MSDIKDQVAAGIAKEKTRESIAVMMVIGDVLLSLSIGNATNVTVGVMVMVVLMFPIWRYYSRS